MIVGLDLSTSTTGITVLTNEGKMVYNKAVVLNKFKTIKKVKYPDYEDNLSKAEAVEKELIYINDNYDITSVVVEKPFQNRQGKTSKQVLMTIAGFNFGIRYICYKIFGIKPTFANVTIARNYFDIPKVKQGKENKIQVMKFLMDIYPDFEVKHTKTGSIADSTLDRSDSLLMAYIYYVRIILNGEDTTTVLDPPPKKKVTKKMLKEEQEMYNYHITKWMNSGISQKAYCDEYGLKSGKFTHWKKKRIHL